MSGVMSIPTLFLLNKELLTDATYANRLQLLISQMQTQCRTIFDKVPHKLITSSSNVTYHAIHSPDVLMKTLCHSNDMTCITVVIVDKGSLSLETVGVQYIVCY